MKVAEIITQKFITAIETSGALPWTKPWRVIMPKNVVSGKAYKGINALILSLFGNDSHFLTFNQTKAESGFVKQGSKGIQVVYYRTLDRKGADGNPIMRANGKAEQIPLLRYYVVFRLADVEGCEKLKAKAAKDTKVIDFVPVEQCERLIAGNGIATEHGASAAYYDPAKHAITMPGKETFASVEQYYATRFHEIGHAYGKEMGKEFERGKDAYSKEELVAELFTNFCLSFCGVDSSKVFDNSVAYLQSWLNAIKADPKMLISAASDAQKRFDLLLSKCGLAVEATEADD